MENRKRPRSSSGLRRTESSSELQPPTRVPRGGSAAPAPVETGAGAVIITIPRPRSLDSFAPTETAEFLKVCGCCSRRLGPGRDTFIYLGEVAFCSHECRQTKMNFNEFFPPASGGGGITAGP